VEYGILFPADQTEYCATAVQNTIPGWEVIETETISVTGATIILKGYSSGFEWSFTPTKAGTLYNAETGAVVASLSANQTYTYSYGHDSDIDSYYFEY